MMTTNSHQELTGTDHALNKSQDCALLQPGVSYALLPWFYLFLALLGFLTNSLVLYELWKNRKKPTAIFALNIVSSDIIICISFLFRIVFYHNNKIWDVNGPLCRFVLLVVITVFYVNIYCNMCFLLWTSINRYVTVVQPGYMMLQVFKDPGKCWILCAATWLLVSVTVIVRVQTNQDLFEDVSGTCFHLMVHHLNEVQFSLILGPVIFFMILGAMVLSYSLIMYHLQKISTTSLVSSWFGAGGGLRVKRKILASVLVFLTCFLPHNILRTIMLVSGNSDCTTQQKYAKAKSATVLVAALNCCLNPILYLVFRTPCCQGQRHKSTTAVQLTPSRSCVTKIHIENISTA